MRLLCGSVGSIYARKHALEALKELVLGHMISFQTQADELAGVGGVLASSGLHKESKRYGLSVGSPLE